MNHRPPPRRRPLVAVALGLLFVGAGVADAGAQAPPSPADVLGWELGERFTDVAGVNRYMRALADASELVSVTEYGRTVEDRPLIQVLIASTEHRARLDEILASNRELTRPGTSGERAREIAAGNPAVVYFSYGVHGNESSSSEAAMWTAWDLARGAEAVAGVLDSVVVVVDPVVNPDGRDRYVNWYRQARAREPNPDPASREHDEPWPGGRYNHYLFDLNRDWTWMSQPETRARLATWDRWNPQVHVDFHEMSPRSSYFFFPPTPPINPIYPEHVLEWGRRIGAGNAGAFDEEGWLYFTEESYDLFYPGYGDSWPSLLGSIGMTYEQGGGGGAGLAYRRPDGSILTLRDRAMHHRTAGRATLRTAAEGKTDLLLGFAGTYRNVDEGLSDILLVPGDDPGPASDLVGLLLDQGVRVERASAGFEADAEAHPGYDGRSRFPAGSYRVPVRQSRGRLAAALLRPDNPLDAEFSYDITAWSLPYAYGVEAHSLTGELGGEWRPVEEAPGRTAESGASGAGRYGYLMRPGFDGARALVDFLEAGGRAVAVEDTFTVAGRSFPRGTVFLPRGRNDDLDGRIAEAGLGRHLVPVETGRTEGGPDLGTNDARALELPRVALLAGRGTSPTSFGAHWFFLERRLEIPFDAVNVTDVSRTDLGEYDVVVVPSGRGLESALGEPGEEALDGWVRRGGVLVAVEGAARSLGAELADVETRTALEEDGEESREERLDEALRTRREREEERWRESMPGTVLRAALDPRHPLAWGSGAGNDPGALFVLSDGTVFEPGASVESPVWFPEGVERISGVVSEANLERMARGSWLLEKDLGDGTIVLFADDPLFRMFWYGAFQPYVNALLTLHGE